MRQILMPVVGHDIATGKIVQWIKQENEQVKEGEIILLVESEKATFEVEAEVSGTLLKIYHREEEEVGVLQPVGIIGNADEFDTIEETVMKEGTDEMSISDDDGIERKTSKHLSGSADDRIHVSPVARKTAKEHGTSLSRIKGTGPHGRIIKRDVLREIKIVSEHPETMMDERYEERVTPFSKERSTIARRLTKSKQDIPHFYLFVDVDMEKALSARKTYKKKKGTHITINDLIVYACARGLREYPLINSYVTKSGMIVKEDVNIGVAVSTKEGLLVIVVPEADKKSIDELSKELKNKVSMAREGKMMKFVESTFTVSSLGMFGVNSFLPIINPPESAILGVGQVEERVVPIEGMIGIHKTVTLGLSADHRAVDGAYAADFLNYLKEFLQEKKSSLL